VLGCVCKHPRVSPLIRLDTASLCGTGNCMMKARIAPRVLTGLCVILTGVSLTACWNPNDSGTPVSTSNAAPVPAGTPTVTLSWEAPTGNSDGSALVNLTGYKVYYGSASGNYTQQIRISNPGLNTYVVDNLPPGQYYFAVTAYNSLGEESDYSPEISATVVN
jgi:hypothetical protein